MKKKQKFQFVEKGMDYLQTFLVALELTLSKGIGKHQSPIKISLMSDSLCLTHSSCSQFKYTTNLSGFPSQAHLVPPPQ